MDNSRYNKQMDFEKTSQQVIIGNKSKEFYIKVSKKKEILPLLKQKV